MKKEFYIGQPLIIKETGEKVVLLYKDDGIIAPYTVRGASGLFYKDYHNLEPSTEFKFSEIMTGLEQGYFEVGTKFTILNGVRQTLEVTHDSKGLYLDLCGSFIVLTSTHINSTWRLLESRKKMTLEEIEAELGYKIKLT